VNASDYAWRVRVRLEEMAKNAREAPSANDGEARDARAYARGLEAAREVLVEVLRETKAVEQR
jgi:hypothetical protein